MGTNGDVHQLAQAPEMTMAQEKAYSKYIHAERIRKLQLENYAEAQLAQHTVGEVVACITRDEWLAGVYINFESTVSRLFFETFALTMHGKAGGVNVLVNSQEQRLAVQLLVKIESKSAVHKVIKVAANGRFTISEIPIYKETVHTLIRVAPDGCFTITVTTPDRLASETAAAAQAAVDKSAADAAASGRCMTSETPVDKQAAEVNAASTAVDKSPADRAAADAVASASGDALSAPTSSTERESQSKDKKYQKELLKAEYIHKLELENYAEFQLAQHLVSRVITSITEEQWARGMYIFFESAVSRVFFETFALIMDGKAGGLQVSGDSNKRLLFVQLTTITPESAATQVATDKPAAGRAADNPAASANGNPLPVVPTPPTAAVVATGPVLQDPTLVAVTLAQGDGASTAAVGTGSGATSPGASKAVGLLSPAPTSTGSGASRTNSIRYFR